MRRKKNIEPEIKKPVTRSAWTKDVLILKSLLVPYRISGKVGDIKAIPVDLVDKLVKAKRVKEV